MTGNRGQKAGYTYQDMMQACPNQSFAFRMKLREKTNTHVLTCTLISSGFPNRPIANSSPCIPALRGLGSDARLIPHACHALQTVLAVVNTSRSPGPWIQKFLPLEWGLVVIWTRTNNCFSIWRVVSDAILLSSILPLLLPQCLYSHSHLIPWHVCGPLLLWPQSTKGNAGKAQHCMQKCFICWSKFI